MWLGVWAYLIGWVVANIHITLLSAVEVGGLLLVACTQLWYYGEACMYNVRGHLGIVLGIVYHVEGIFEG
jgi:hypothetical protein